MENNILLKGFVKIRPEFEIDQNNYAQMNNTIQYQAYLKENNDKENIEFKNLNFQKIKHYMCKSDRIKKRAFFIPDMLNEDPNLRVISNTNRHHFGANLKERMEVFEKISLKLFNEFYVEESYRPDILCFTTSSGYIAPSPVQTFLSNRGWLNTNVFQVSHTGCYGAFPSINIAAGQLSYRLLSEGKALSAEIVHIEANFLHYNPSQNDTAQLINHSLFGDGAIKYKVEFENEHNCQNALKLMYTFDKILPNTTDIVKFWINDFSFHNVMSKHLADVVITNIDDYLKELCSKAMLNYDDMKENAVFALHPGGPKILDGITKKLSLKPWQVENSYWVLENYGNMASATLPHVLERIVKDDNLKGKYVIAIGMSPGLTLGSAVFKRV
ncbi:3-oxoacyl-[acyl-carrier-protein] synthase III C-terminal domain-containing protein [Fluviispira vulneris]|uniref:3-oxoacyl-[acyl-carrier-protein] synthase III C-terminal domain-containing protein n=1 Tax=Fluviispira vulneris TaxID=2763012 RepID=UPI0016465CEE|nr:3-oxoacyl-[acyl-carrier-protein] synthase III C-terminal domain-containing protein [Fluviispira vulneris]